MLARVKVVVHEEAVSQLLRETKAIRDIMVRLGQQVASEAESTAGRAQEGSGGRVTGYAEAGFSVEWENRGTKRPHVNVVSNNHDAKTLEAVYWHTQKRDGVTHLRAALYKFTRRG